MIHHSIGEAIKWPDLNTHGESPLALPTNRAAAFETSSEVNLTRADSRAASDVTGGAASSVADLYNASADPYAVPPLPHLNPNLTQPYRDDPSAAYYDPYKGPVPQTFEPGEAIPMTQIGAARARSPMPQGTMDSGRVSPGPQVAYGYGGPPQAQGAAMYGGRMSPGPQAAYGGRMSPGPQAAYGGGRTSPGPQVAYGGAPGGYGP